MPFSTDSYHLNKKLIIDQIKAIHDWENTEGFIADGVINPEIYADQPLKILVLLGESYGYSECEVVDIEDQTEEDVLGVGHPNRQTSKKVSALVAAPVV